MKRLIALMAAFYLPFAGASYKCVDEKGVTRIGDTPPAGCEKVELLELSRSGTVIRRIPAPLTPEQVKAQQAEAEARKQAERAAADQKRKDEALLASFSQAAEFDVTRDRNIEPLKGRIKTAEDRLKAIATREKQMAEELEFYRSGKSKAGRKAGDGPPAYLVSEQERLGTEKESLKRSVAGIQKEIEEIRVKYDSDKKRWVELKGGAERR